MKAGADTDMLILDIPAEFQAIARRMVEHQLQVSLQQDDTGGLKAVITIPCNANY